MASVHKLLCPGCGKHFGNVLTINSDRKITQIERDSCWCNPCARIHEASTPPRRPLPKSTALKAKEIADELKAKRITLEEAFLQVLELVGHRPG